VNAITQARRNRWSFSIEDAKQILPLPNLMALLGHGDHAKRSSLSPFRDERHPSFSVFQSQGRWYWKDHGTGECGDEITYLEKALSLRRADAIRQFLGMALEIKHQPANPHA
jgi:hypothetical protein